MSLKVPCLNEWFNNSAALYSIIYFIGLFFSIGGYLKNTHSGNYSNPKNQNF